MIDRRDACRLLNSLVSIPSISGNESDLAHFLNQEMTQLGFQSRIDDAGNIVGSIGAADHPVVVLLGHIDTVPGHIPVTESDGLLFGRGTVDAKGPLATFICSAANSRFLPMRIVVVGAVEEETTSRGAKHVISHLSPDAVFIGEPSGASGITVGYKGQIKGSFGAARPAAHSAAPGLNALDELFAFWSQVMRCCESSVNSERHFDRLDASIVSIEGDVERAQLIFDVRIPPSLAVDTVSDRLHSLLHDGNLELFNPMPPTVQPQNSAVARSLRRAIRTEGLEPRVKVKTGTCDMNTTCRDWSAPMVAYGPGDSSLDHTAQEHISLDEYWKAVQILTKALSFLSEDLTSAKRA